MQIAVGQGEEARIVVEGEGTQTVVEEEESVRTVVEEGEGAQTVVGSLLHWREWP